MDARWCATEDAVAHVFVGALDDDVTITGADGHHLQRARRVRVGEAITAADGVGNWRRYDVRSIRSGVLELAAGGPVYSEPEPDPPIGLALALTKAGIEKVSARCTELGVDRIEPVRTRRSVITWDDARAAAAVTRLRTIVREAAAQSRRARIPDVAPVGDLAALVTRPGLVIADRAGIAAHELRTPSPDGWTVLVGPEGGFDAEELAAFLPETPRLAVGPHVLRAETAPVAVIAALRSKSS